MKTLCGHHNILILQVIPFDVIVELLDVLEELFLGVRSPAALVTRDVCFLKHFVRGVVPLYVLLQGQFRGQGQAARLTRYGVLPLVSGRDVRIERGLRAEHGVAVLALQRGLTVVVALVSQHLGTADVRVLALVAAVQVGLGVVGHVAGEVLHP